MYNNIKIAPSNLDNLCSLVVNINANNRVVEKIRNRISKFTKEGRATGSIREVIPNT